MWCLIAWGVVTVIGLVVVYVACRRAPVEEYPGQYDAKEWEQLQEDTQNFGPFHP